MAVMFAEAAPEVVAGASSGAGTAAATEAAGGTTGGYFGGVTARPSPPAGSSPGARAPRGRGRAGRAPAPEGTGAPRGGQTPVPWPGDHAGRQSVSVDLGVGWHRVVMAEFIAAVLILVLAPVLTPDDSTGSKGFFKAADIVRLTAVCFVFVVLAMITNGQKIGKFAAAFGGLVVAGVMVNNASGTQSIFAAIAAIFSSASGTQTASDDTAVIDPDLVYGEAGASVLTQLAGGGGGAAPTTAPVGGTTPGPGPAVPA